MVIEIFAVIGLSVCCLLVGKVVVDIIQLFQRVKQLEFDVKRLFEIKNDTICRFQRLENHISILEQDNWFRNQAEGKMKTGTNDSDTPHKNPLDDIHFPKIIPKND